MNIREFLECNGPSLSSKIKKQLMAEGMSDEAARQAISRLKGEIYRLTEIKFPKRETFLYLKSQYKSDIFYYNLSSAIEETSSIHKCIISGLRNFGGCLPIEKLKVLSGCPQARKKKKTFDQTLHELEAVNLVYNNEEFYYLNDSLKINNELYNDNKLILYLNDFIKESLALWLRKNSLVSYEAVSFYGDFSSYIWDITAPSYLLPFIKIKADATKPGFIVADIIPQSDIGNTDIDYFIRKVESCFLEKNTRPFIPIILGYSFEHETLKFLKSKNILVSTIYNFFGEEIEKILKNIEKTLKATAINDVNSIENINTILTAVSKIEGETNNLRGHFFELIAGHVVSNIYAGIPRLNQKIAHEGKKAEIDILIITSKEIIIYECKGYINSRLVSNTDIEKWKNKISIIYNYFKSKDEHSNKKVVFNYWTTSDFSDDAKNNLMEFSNDLRKYVVRKMNGNEIFNYSKELNLENICGILKQYFPYNNKAVRTYL
ncbi:NERD domain-containing protein [Treponema primitia]|uniref:NERD domain-containing protein n=1 Tax=Treponema primitia TaxID=88058 RepID=UPI0002554C02|nr:NERD domain-containing protein [Treponema primitia]